MNKILFLFTFVIIISVSLSNYSLANELVLDLNTALNITLENNTRLRQIEKDVEIADWNKKISFSTYMPQLTARFSVSDFHRHPTIPYDENYQFDLVLRQSILNLSQIANIKAASIGKNYQKEHLYSYRQMILFDCLKHFYQCLLAQEKKILREKALSLSEEELHIAQARYKEGLISYYELLRSETKKLNALAELRKAQAEYQKILNELKNILGYTQDKKIILEGKLKPKISEFNPEYLTQKIYFYHPDIAAVNYLIDQKEQNIRSSQAEFLPKINLEITRSAAKYYNVETANEWDDYWTAYLIASFPLFEGTGRYSQLKKSQQEYKQAELEKKELINEIEKNIDSFYQDYIAAKDLIKLEERNLKKSEELYELVRKRYVLGESSEIELLDAHLHLIATESSYKEAAYQVIISYYGMLLSAGQLEIEKINFGGF